MTQVLTFLLAQSVGWVSTRVRVPGSGIIIPMFITAAVSVAGVQVDVSPWVRFAILALMGAAIGAQVDRASIRAMRHLLLSASIAAVAIMLLGLLSAVLLRTLGIAPHGDLLATSPGALSAMTAAALENDFDAPSVAIFHVTRIILIVLSIPLLARLMASDARNAGGALDRPAPGAATSPSRSGASGVPTEPVGHRTIETPGWESPSDRLAAMVRFLLPTLGAVLGAVLGVRAGLPFPIVVTAFIGGGIVALAVPATSGLPRAAGLFVQSGLAWLIGSMVDRDTLATLGPVITGALLSSVILISGGIAIALALRRVGIAPRGDVLATSPGALEVLTLLATQHGANPVDVGLFHLVRLLLVMLTLPVLLMWTL